MGPAPHDDGRDEGAEKYLGVCHGADVVHLIGVEVLLRAKWGDRRSRT
jgi:hypothetical protein